MTFWNSATTDQKLAQIDGGIELGMTTSQIAMNCGAEKHLVRYFGESHGRRFPARSASIGKLRAAQRLSARTQARSKGIPEIHSRSAFDIFGAASSPRLFSSHPHDEEALT